MLELIKNNLNNISGNAFCINDKYYKYSDLKKEVAKIQNLILSQNDYKIIGVVTHNSIETYASIIAIWLSGKTFVPINPNFPDERNKEICKLSSINILLDNLQSNNKSKSYFSKEIINSSTLSDCDNNVKLIAANPEEIIYILFTSGSTGSPKGVPISYSNVSAFIGSFLEYEYKITNKDKFLQVFDLTFDASIDSYLIPLLFGACIYTVPNKGIKYMQALNIMQKYDITFAKLTPSLVKLLQPLFNRINLNSLRFCLFGGEGLSLSLCEEWKSCIPNAFIHNLYGPTEATVECFIYELSNDTKKIKHYKDIISIGKPTKKTEIIIIDKNNKEVPINQKGELCLSGYQLTKGYLNNEALNNSSFINLEINGISKRFYKTGDIAFIDKDGDVMYCGRIDDQVKIQGYRVELKEIELCVMESKLCTFAIAIFVNEKIYIFGDIALSNINNLELDLEKKLPNFMIPHKIIAIKNIPLNNNGKINITKLKELIKL